MKLLALRLVLLSGLLGLCAWVSGRAYADIQWEQQPGPPEQKSMSKCAVAADCVTVGCTSLNPPVVVNGTALKSYRLRITVKHGTCKAETAFATTCYQYPNVPCASVYAYTDPDCKTMVPGFQDVYSGNCTP